jgi:hypothetical protein
MSGQLHASVALKPSTGSRYLLITPIVQVKTVIVAHYITPIVQVKTVIVARLFQLDLWVSRSLHEATQIIVSSLLASRVCRF